MDHVCSKEQAGLTIPKKGEKLNDAEIKKLSSESPLAQLVLGGTSLSSLRQQARKLCVFVMWGLRRVHVGFSVPYPSLVCVGL